MCYYEMHDGKMICALTQHSQWSRKVHPFLLCACQRGKGVTDPNHECQIITHSDQVTLFERSKRRLERQLEKQLSEPKHKYNEGIHRDWCDVNNSGITHYGFHPDVLPRDNIRF